jgi:Lactonase, 7-bladed beta-propeller
VLRFSWPKTVVVVLLFVIVAVAATAFVTRWWTDPWRNWVGPIALDDARRISFVRSPSNIHFAPLFVGVAAIDEGHLVLADYSRLYCLQLDSGHLSVVKPDLDGGWPPTWIPTGVAYDQERKHLFVTNYRGNQVFEGLLDCTAQSFSILHTIASRDTISPENVAVSEDGATLAVANYDGGNIATFRRDSSGQWTALWSQRVPSAHGVAILHRAAYATSLQDGTVARFDLDTGRLLRRKGGKGWNPRRNETLWPTALTRYRQRLLLSDAHTGLVCQLDPEELKREWCFGGNGPSPEQFNMPYGVTSLGTDIAVASSFQGRVLVIRREHDVAKALADYVPDDRTWLDIARIRRNLEIPASAWLPTYQRPWISKAPYGPYLSDCDLGTPLEGLRCGYGSVWKDSKQQIQLPRTGGVLNSCGYYYFVESYRGKVGTTLFSPQNACLVYLSREASGAVGLIVRRIRQGSWRVGDYIVSGSEVLAFSDLDADFRAVLARIQTKRLHGGVLLPEDAARVFFPDLDDSETRVTVFAKRLRVALESPEERAFTQIYLACNREQCAATKLRDLARALSNAKGNVTLESKYLPCFLSGARCLAR